MTPLDRRRFLKRAALWIAAPAIVRVANIMPVKAMSDADEWARAAAQAQMLIDRLNSHFVVQWIGSSVFIPAPLSDGATAEEAFDHFLDATGTRVGDAA